MARFKYSDVMTPLAKQRVDEALRAGSGVKKSESRSVILDGGTCKDSPGTLNPRSQPRNVRPAPSSYSPVIVRAYFRDHHLPEPCFEYQFHPVRKWRFDLAWPEKRVAIEVQGGIWMQGRHVQPAALIREYEKLNSAAIHGWRLLYILPDDLCRASTVVLLKLMLL